MNFLEADNDLLIFIANKTSVSWIFYLIKIQQNNVKILKFRFVVSKYIMVRTHHDYKMFKPLKTIIKKL